MKSGDIHRRQEKHGVQVERFTVRLKHYTCLNSGLICSKRREVTFAHAKVDDLQLCWLSCELPVLLKLYIKKALHSLLCTCPIGADVVALIRTSKNFFQSLLFSAFFATVTFELSRQNSFLQLSRVHLEAQGKENSRRCDVHKARQDWNLGLESLAIHRRDFSCLQHTGVLKCLYLLRLPFTPLYNVVQFSWSPVLFPSCYHFCISSFFYLYALLYCCRSLCSPFRIYYNRM